MESQEDRPRKKRAAHHRSESPMPKVVIPCYGGPYCGRFYPEDRSPIGYRALDVAKNTRVYVWKPLKVELLDFTILRSASKIKPEEADGGVFEE